MHWKCPKLGVILKYQKRLFDSMKTQFHNTKKCHRTPLFTFVRTKFIATLTKINSSHDGQSSNRFIYHVDRTSEILIVIVTPMIK